MVARERHESHISQYGELLAKAKQLKIVPLLKILTVYDKERLLSSEELFYRKSNFRKNAGINGLKFLKIFKERQSQSSQKLERST